MRVMSPSRMVYDISGKGFTRFRGVVAIESGCLRDDIQPKTRFFVFDEEPNMERLVPVGPETPGSAGVPPASRFPVLVDRVFRHALGRAPSLAERRLAETAVRDPRRPGRVSAAGLADLLWSLLMSPDFQLIY